MAHYDEYYERWYCGDCSGRSFVNRHSLDQHLLKSPNHDYCLKCERDFSSPHALDQHLRNSSSHAWCDRCDEDFDDDDELLDHYRQAHYFCDSCEEVFWDEDDLDRHRSNAHYYCKPCDRFFQNANNLKMHLNSSTHRPRDIPCIMRGCDRKFISHADLVKHWESGTCVSKVNRRMIDEYIVRHDERDIITNSRRMINNGGRNQYPFTEPNEYRATERAWNGDAYECYLCHKSYGSLTALNQHLASPIHSGGRNKIYRCPQIGCSTQFNTLSGLVQHIETGSCGAFQNQFVQGAIENLSRNFKSLTF